MSLRALEPGIQATLQANPRTGLRHWGMPSSGPADPVAMAIANRLVNRPPGAVAIEITNGPAHFEFTQALHIGLAGARAIIRLNDEIADAQQTLAIAAGTRLGIAPFDAGARLYLAVSGTLEAQIAFGSAATYLPASIGGHHGRAMKRGDVIEVFDVITPPIIRVPMELQRPLTHSFVLRAVDGPDATDTPARLNATVTHRASRMGLELDGNFAFKPAGGERPSAALLPGAVQVTPSGQGFLLGPDAQTTGGYPHVLQVIRADRHLIGQLRPGDRIEFLRRSQAEAEAALAAKQALLAGWLEGFKL